MKPLNLEALRAATPTDRTEQDTSTRARPARYEQNATSTRARAHARTGPETPYQNAAAWCFAQHIERHGPPPVPGAGHNSWLAALTKFCNESGADLSDVLAQALDTAPAGHNAGKIEATVKGIYGRDAAQHNTKPWEPYAPRPGGNTQGAAAGGGHTTGAAPVQTLDTPLIPAEVYQLLPELLRQCCQPMPTHRERDVVLTGALAVLSGCFPTLEGQYRGPVIGANVYAFIVAPAASGKGALNWARKLAWPHHLAVREASQRERDAYEMQLQEYEQQKRTAKAGGVLPPKPVEPARRRLFIAADNGAANVVKTLAENEERGIICETEADALTGALKQDFGDYSALLRKCSEHEPHQYDRKTAGTYELSRPALSVAIGGTPEQVGRLIPSAEDGLFSRFWFYAFEAPHEWDNPFAEGGPNLDTWFERLSVRVSEMIAAAAAGRILVELTEAQQTRFNAAWQQWLSEGVADFGEGSGSAVKRHARACFRLCMLLTLLRCFDNGEAPAGRTLTCEDDDLTAALLIADVYRAHALALYERLPRPVGSGYRQPTKYAGKAAREAQVLALHAQGLSLREIEAQTGIPFNTVRRWVS